MEPLHSHAKIFPLRIHIITKLTFYKITENWHHLEEEIYAENTSPQVHQVEDQALNGTCSDMHSTHQSQVPGNAYKLLQLIKNIYKLHQTILARPFIMYIRIH